MRVLYHLCSRETKRTTQYNMREWLSGGAPPCQGGGRGFDPRLALYEITKKDFLMGSPFLLSKKCKALLVTQLQSSCGSISRETKVSLGRARAEVHRTSWHPSRRTFYASLRSCQSRGPPDLLAPVSQNLLRFASVVSKQRSTGPLDFSRH